jgi:hypothetical protein
MDADLLNGAFAMNASVGPRAARTVAALAAAWLAWGPIQARADDPGDPKQSELRTTLIVTGSAALLAGVFALESKKLSPDHCRFCTPNRLDGETRRALVWDHPANARLLSDVSANGLVPLLAFADAWRAQGPTRRAAEDLLVVTEAAMLATAATEVSKNFVARRRPEESRGGTSSFWSGHTAFAFSVVVAQATQDSMRDDPRAPWVWAIGLGAATAVGYFRVAGDAHWLTDVLAGAAAGSLAGAAAPLLNRHLVGSMTISPAPGGLALRW